MPSEPPPRRLSRKRTSGRRRSQMVALETGIRCAIEDRRRPADAASNRPMRRPEAGGAGRSARTNRRGGEIEAEADAEARGRPMPKAKCAEGERRKPVAEDEGPEPARIPTSLTATLREQGARYPHRVSRRTRRKGRRRSRSRTGRPARSARRAASAWSRAPSSAPCSGRKAVRKAGPKAGRKRRPERRPEARPEARPRRSPLPSISDLLREGQEIIVQIAKEPLGQKGARITSHIALPGRFLVYMPTVDHIGVSRKIPSDEERLRLKRDSAGQPHRHSGRLHRAHGGRRPHRRRTARRHDVPLQPVARHAAEGRAPQPAPLLIHHDLNVVERILRDQLTTVLQERLGG